MRRTILANLSFSVLIAGLLGFAAVSYALPSANALYNETDLAGGWWQYDYTLYNTSDPVTEAGFDLYDIFFAFDSAATFAGLSIPAGWDEISGAGFAEDYSLNAGTPPIGTDIAPGTSLNGFSFKLDYQAGDLAFDVLFANPADPANPVLYSSTTLLNTVATVPEPATTLLLGFGLVGLAGMRPKLSR